ncbi:MAG: hypothetical protein ACJA08_003105 [Cyclobacteriaceae bacterium]|jgi:hypothetical protein
MAQLNKTDDFFRSKLYSAEVAPAINSWAQVQKGIGTNVTPWYVGIGKIAAVGIVLITAAVVLFYLPKKDEKWLAGMTDHPMIEIKSNVEIIVPELEIRSLVNHKKPAKTDAKKPAAINVYEPIIVLAKELEVDRITPQVFTIEPKEMTLIEIANNRSVKTPQVKITYIASSENPDSDQPLERINRVVVAAQQVSPSELLADLREAKNHLLGFNGSGMNILNRN